MRTGREDTNFTVIPAVCPCTSSVPSLLLYMWKSILPPSVRSRRCFRIPAAFSRIALTLEPSCGLLTAVGPWPGAVIYLVILCTLQLPVAIACTRCQFVEVLVLQRPLNLRAKFSSN